MSEIVIRPSIEADLPELIALNHLIWNGTNSPATIHYPSVTEYAEHYPPGSQFVAVIANRVAGYIGYKNPTGLLSNSHVLEIDIGVHPDFQRSGVGKQLIDYILSGAKKTAMIKFQSGCSKQIRKPLLFIRQKGLSNKAD